MNRRKFVRNTLFSSVALATVTNVSESAGSAPTQRPNAFEVFELNELTLDDLQKGMASGRPGHAYLQRPPQRPRRGRSVRPKPREPDP